MKIDKPELLYLLDMANDMRAAKGDDLLADLPDSWPRDAASCLVANAFNYGCTVIPGCSVDEDGTIAFLSEKDRETYCKITGAQPYNDEDYEPGGDFYGEKRTYWNAWLTDDLQEIAIAFDEGHYDEYDLTNNDWVDEL